MRVLRATQGHWQGLNGSDVHFLRTPLSAMALLRVKDEARRPGIDTAIQARAGGHWSQGGGRSGWFWGVWKSGQEGTALGECWGVEGRDLSDGRAVTPFTE